MVFAVVAGQPKKGTIICSLKVDCLKENFSLTLCGHSRYEKRVIFATIPTLSFLTRGTQKEKST